MKEEEHKEDIVVDGRILLKLMLENMVGMCGFVSSGSGQGPVAVSVSTTMNLPIP
jgi:hypothetical protein